MKYAATSLFILVLSVLWFAIPQPVDAYTSVLGSITSDTTWFSSEVYVVNAGTIVNPGVTLTIEPGTVIKFNPEGYIYVYGEIVANGTLEDKIYLTSIRDDSVGGDTNGDGSSSLPASADWYHLWIVPGGSLNLQYSVVRFGGGGWPHYSNIAMSGDNLSVSNSTISDSSSTGIRIYDGSVNILNSSISNNDYGIVKEGGSISMSNSAIYGNSEYGMYNGTFSEINAENNWWGHSTGPGFYDLWGNNAGGEGDFISSRIDYTPWLTTPPVFEEPPSTKVPVLIIPGMAGSELYNGDDLIWADLNQMFRDVGDEFLTENLSLDDGGISVKNISTGEVIKGAPLTNIFEGLDSVLAQNGYHDSLYYFPYDWRLDLNDTAISLSAEVERIKLETGHEKVSIIAHSMGGLLAKEYIRQNGKNSIDKLIFVGTPHLGAPKAGKVLLEGDNFSIPWLEEERIKEIAKNSIALHELLPTQSYFDLAGSYIKELLQIIPSEVSNLLDYEETRQFLINDGSSSDVFELAYNFFSNNLESLDLSGINVYNIAGCKTPTHGGYLVYPNGYISDIKYRAGDKTVPFVSGNAINLPESNKFYSIKGSHIELPSQPGVSDLIADILSGQSLGSYENISTDTEPCKIKGKETIWRSPVEVHVYDSLGRHVGPVEGGIEYGIPEVDYEILGHEKFVFLPTDNSENYRIVAHGLDTGTFDLSVRDNNDGTVISEITFEDVPVTTATDVQFNIGDATLMGISVDENGDGAIDIEYLSDGSWITHNITVQSTIDDIERASALGWIAVDIKNSLINLLKAALSTEITTKSKGKQADGVLGTAFLKQLYTEYNKGSINLRSYIMLREDIWGLL